MEIDPLLGVFVFGLIMIAAIMAMLPAAMLIDRYREKHPPRVHSR